MSRVGNTITLTPDSTIEQGRSYSAEHGWDSVPSITLDGLTILVPDPSTVHRLLCAVARLDVATRDIVVAGDPT